MNLDKFGQQIEEVLHRSQLLEDCVSTSPRQHEHLLAQAFEELRTALEELRVAEEELRQQNEQLVVARQEIEVERLRYQELFEFAPDGYLVTDTYGKILEANRAAATVLNISKNYLIGKTLSSFVPEEERYAFRSQLTRLHDIEQIQEWEIRLQPRRGHIFDASLNVTTIKDKQGQPLGWRWLVRDITARKQAEAKLQAIQLQNMQLQEVARIRTQIMSVLSHELRTPMNSILGFSQLLLRRYYHLFPPEIRDMVERIIKSGKHLLTLIESILDFSRLESDKLELKLQELNLVELVTATTEELRLLAEQKNLALVVHSNLENPRIVNDSVRVQQVLVNLISNAIKFTETGGVFVEVQQLNPNRVVLMVKDTGIGIPESELTNIFQEFWQVDRSTTRKQGGVGLGLAIVEKLVRLMKGTITVSSNLGQGSTFRVELPRQICPGLTH
ncbi:PAS/PAC sensor signal transduction histidine kinase [Scytonema sp. HK-05]|uniref:PAS domain-containing sensor histidine kinase n=1 Tax=Scytonema sp. HK-05 TaxID=1137095 RepID=UPI000937FD56|nr:ATP-binding protein [Scytonema sp. HK-05]OKH61104.1 PAS domain-containing sensor histidine kinase [Scytonema sp. HK-05]BAY46468.1 PAS/PAC sensor signal transduction histidine kinase [Scytonema sp. HK-05]